MLSQIKTSKENKEIVTKLTHRLNLGAENVIARMAITYSLSQGEKLKIEDLSNSSGKEYSKGVLFGENFDIYRGLICSHYNIYKTDKNIPKYLKLHMDHGLDLLNKELKERPNVEGFDFVAEKIEGGLKTLK